LARLEKQKKGFTGSPQKESKPSTPGTVSDFTGIGEQELPESRPNTAAIGSDGSRGASVDGDKGRVEGGSSVSGDGLLDGSIRGGLVEDGLLEQGGRGEEGLGVGDEMSALHLQGDMGRAREET